MPFLRNQLSVYAHRHIQQFTLLNLKAPTNLVSSFDVPSISGVVGWTDTNAGKAEYEVYRSVNGGADTLLTTTAKGATSYADTGCKQNASVVYKIKAKIGTKVGDLVVATALITPLCWKTNQSVLTPDVINILNITEGKSVTVKYSDGTSQAYSGNNVNITKNFAVIGQYDCWIEGDVNFITSFTHNAQPRTIGNIANYILPSGLLGLFVNATGLTGSISDLNFPASITTFRIDSTGISGNISNKVLPASLVNFYINTTGLTGSLPQITAHATNGLIYNAYACSFSDSNVTVFRKAMTVFNVGNQNVVFPTPNIDKLLKALADWYQVNAPTANCTFTLSGANMGIPTGGSSNVDLVRLVNYYTAAGRTATVLVRTS